MSDQSEQLQDDSGLGIEGLMDVFAKHDQQSSKSEGNPDEEVDDTEGQDEPDDSEDDLDDEESDEESAEENPEEAPKEVAAVKLLLPKKDEEGNDVVDEAGKPVMEEYDQKALIEAVEIQRNYAQERDQLVQYIEQAKQYVETEVTQSRKNAIDSIMQIGVAVQRVAGTMPPDKLAELAQTDPAAYVQRKAWNDHVAGILQQVGGEIQSLQKQEAEQHQQRNKAAEQERMATAWRDLQQEGINRAAVKAIFGNTAKYYGVTSDELSRVLDAKYVLIMKDAVSFRQLKEAKPEVKNKVNATAKTTQTKAPSNRNMEKSNEAFKQIIAKKGRANTDDLAAFMRNRQ
jgi:hypothetical protein